MSKRETEDEKPTEQNYSLPKRLAHNEKKVRDSAIVALTQWLNRPDEISELDMMKLWKGLFYCFWMSDKEPVQDELATNMSGLLLVIEPPERGMLFLDCFFKTMRREWERLDRLRMDKFMRLVRKFVYSSLLLLQRSHWDNMLVVWVTATMGADLFVAKHRGLLMHLVDVLLPELTRLHEEGNGKAIDALNLQRLLEPFYLVLTHSHDVTVIRRVTQGVFEAIIQIAKETKEEHVLRPVILQLLPSMSNKLFRLASDDGTDDSMRNRLYKLRLACKDQITKLKLDENDVFDERIMEDDEGDEGEYEGDEGDDYMFYGDEGDEYEGDEGDEYFRGMDEGDDYFEGMDEGDEGDEGDIFFDEGDDDDEPPALIPIEQKAPQGKGQKSKQQPPTAPINTKPQLANTKQPPTAATPKQANESKQANTKKQSAASPKPVAHANGKAVQSPVAQPTKAGKGKAQQSPATQPTKPAKGKAEQPVTQQTKAAKGKAQQSPIQPPKPAKVKDVQSPITQPTKGAKGKAQQSPIQPPKEKAVQSPITQPTKVAKGKAQQPATQPPKEKAVQSPVTQPTKAGKGKVEQPLATQPAKRKAEQPPATQPTKLAKGKAEQPAAQPQNAAKVTPVQSPITKPAKTAKVTQQQSPSTTKTAKGKSTNEAKTLPIESPKQPASKKAKQPTTSDAASVQKKNTQATTKTQPVSQAETTKTNGKGGKRARASDYF